MLSEPHLEVAFQNRIGSLAMDVTFKATAPWTILFGASGSGKSTILRVIAGLERPDEGLVRVGGRTLFGEGVDLAAWRRGVRWTGQRTMLFPGMTVAENLAFGVGSGQAGAAMVAFHLEAYAAKRPGELSGGQAQRVAVARAAAGAKGKLLLLDEPFSGLGAEVREELIADLRAWLGETPVISVTHDVGEAFLLGAEIVKIAEGRVVAQGLVGLVLAEERGRLAGVLAR